MKDFFRKLWRKLDYWEYYTDNLKDNERGASIVILLLLSIVMFIMLLLFA